MIFVTVGTTHFDPLIQEIDHLAREGLVDLPVVCQIGSGQYEPRHCEWYRFKPSIEKDFNEAELVITHGGFTVLECIWAEKRMVAVPNSDLPENHQKQFLLALQQEVDFHWIDQVSDLGKAISKALKEKPTPWRPPYLATDLASYLDEIQR